MQMLIMLMITSAIRVTLYKYPLFYDFNEGNTLCIYSVKNSYYITRALFVL